ncbi:hypothetical protein NBRC116493_02450 [Aurantivibrio infirmus]
MKIFEKQYIKKAYRKLAPHLKRQYGGSNFYTIKQIEKSIGILKLSSKYERYAYAIFLYHDELPAYIRESGINEDAYALKKEVGHVLFHGNPYFKTKNNSIGKVGNSVGGSSNYVE